MIALLMLAAAVPPVPAPPPIVALPRVDPASSAPPVTFDVEVRAGGEVQWSGPMRVSGQSPASFSRNKSDAAEALCPSPVYPGASARTSLSVTLTSRRVAPDRIGYNLRVSWDRPGPVADACLAPQSTRTVALTQNVAIEPGQSVTVNGDGGLSVTLRRR